MLRKIKFPIGNDITTIPKFNVSIKQQSWRQGKTSKKPDIIKFS